MRQSLGSIPAAEKEGGKIKTESEAGRHEEVKELAQGHKLSGANSHQRHLPRALAYQPLWLQRHQKAKS